jgi:hypothetical protein
VAGQSARVTNFGLIHRQLRPLLSPTSQPPPTPLLLKFFLTGAATAANTAAATAATAAGPVENPVENPSLNTGGDANAADGAIHVQKLRPWKQKSKKCRAHMWR